MTCQSVSSGSSYAPGSQVALALPLPVVFYEIAEESSSEAAATRSLQVDWASSRYVYNQTDGIRIRFDAVEAVGISPKIFAYRMLPLNPETLERVGTFSHVCSPVDLEEYPEDAAVEGSVPPWYRLSYVDILVRSQAEADDFIATVLEDVDSLIATLNTMDTLPPSSRGSRTFE